MRRKTVVLVCMVDSIHVARWIAQFDPTEVKFILFPSGPNRRVHPKIVEMIERGKQFDNQMTLVPFGGRLSLLLWALDRFFSDRIRGLLLRRVLKKVEPDFVHALELQHAGYVTIRALEDVRIKTPFIATNYGSDIYWFAQFESHRKRIRSILKRANYYSCECSRDLRLASDFGFQGTQLPVIPNSGGFNSSLKHQNAVPMHSRKVVAVKGYENWVGRAGLVIEALVDVREEIEKRNLAIVFYSCNLKTIIKLGLFRMRYGLKTTYFRKAAMTHEQVQDLFAQSRLYIGASLSDGLSTSMLEAMYQGAFVVQTSTSCADEVITPKKTGVLVTEVDRASIAAAILESLRITDAEDDERDKLHRQLSQDFSAEKVSKIACGFYEVGNRK